MGECRKIGAQVLNTNQANMKEVERLQGAAAQVKQVNQPWHQFINTESVTAVVSLERLVDRLNVKIHSWIGISGDSNYRRSHQ